LLQCLPIGSLSPTSALGRQAGDAGGVMTIQAHPLADLFPMMEGVAFDELVADINANGMHEPIVLYEGKILDGRNRYAAWLESTDIDDAPPFTEYTGTDPRGFVISMNVHRRHLDQAQKRTLIEAVLRETPEHSDNRIASTIGVTDKTVTAVREKLESTSEIPKLERTVGKDGKSRPAKKQPTADKTAVVNDPEAEPDVTDEELAAARAPHMVVNGETPRSPDARTAEAIERIKSAITILVEVKRDYDPDLYQCADAFIYDDDLLAAARFLRGIENPDDAIKERKAIARRESMQGGKKKAA
jgi:hypothetical protein